LLLASCGGGSNQSSPPVNIKTFAQKSIRLSNGLGIVSVYVPREFDTTYSFVNIGEYHCAAVKLRRFVSKKYMCCLSPSPDFNYSDMPDSVCQFTIIQTHEKDCEQYLDINDELLKNTQNELSNESTVLAADRKCYIKEINGLKFVVCQLNTNFNGKHLGEVYGITAAEGRMVKFVYQCYSSNNPDFVDRALASLNTIQISADEKAK
jgi:hypothetical protein